jgi:hypothetical protein
MAKQTIEQIRAELDVLNEKMAKKRNVSDLQIIANANNSKKVIENPELIKKQKEGIAKRASNQTWRQTVGGWNKGIPRTEEDLIKMRKPRSEEGKANMRGPREKKTCPHCGFIGGGPNMGRYHFDKCKAKK